MHLPTVSHEFEYFFFVRGGLKLNLGSWRRSSRPQLFILPSRGNNRVGCAVAVCTCCQTASEEGGGCTASAAKNCQEKERSFAGFPLSRKRGRSEVKPEAQGSPMKSSNGERERVRGRGNKKSCFFPFPSRDVLFLSLPFPSTVPHLLFVQLGWGKTE